jgi:hypothetical protein
MMRRHRFVTAPRYLLAFALLAAAFGTVGTAAQLRALEDCSHPLPTVGAARSSASERRAGRSPLPPGARCAGDGAPIRLASGSPGGEAT